MAYICVIGTNNEENESPSAFQYSISSNQAQFTYMCHSMLYKLSHGLFPNLLTIMCQQRYEHAQANICRSISPKLTVCNFRTKISPYPAKLSIVLYALYYQHLHAFLHALALLVGFKIFQISSTWNVEVYVNTVFVMLWTTCYSAQAVPSTSYLACVDLCRLLLYLPNCNGSWIWWWALDLITVRRLSEKSNWTSLPIASEADT